MFVGVSLGGCHRSNPLVSTATPLPTPDPRYEKGAQTAASVARLAVEKATTRAELDAFWKGFNASLPKANQKNAKVRLGALNFYLQPIKELSRTRRQSLPK